MSQYAGQARGQGQQGGSQYGGQNPIQQDPSPYGEQQDQSQYGAQDPSGGYSGQDQSQQNPSQYDRSQLQYGTPQAPSTSYQQGMNGQDQDQQDPSQYSQENQNGHGYAQQKPTQQNQQATKARKPETSSYGQQKEHAMNGHNEESEDDDKAIVKPSSRTAVQGRSNGKHYHHSHLNALHYMGKAASECLRLLFFRALQVLTWKLQATASRQSISTASSTWAPTPWVPLQTPTVLPLLSQLGRLSHDGAVAWVKS